MKHRLERVREVIKRELSEMITREMTFPATLVTVQHVDLTPDLKHAHVFVSALGKDSEKAEVISRLEGHRAELQRELSRRVVLRYTPHLYFKMDESVERGARVMELLDKLDTLPKAGDE